MFYKLIFIALITLVTACSDPKAANEENFKIAIQSYLDTTYPKCYFITKFPTTDEEHLFGNGKVILKSLVSAGIVSVKDESHEITPLFGKKTTVIKPTYNLTEEGKKFYKADVTKNISGNSFGGFCFGKATVKDISQFSEPADMLGQRISEVHFTYVVTEFPAWAKSAEVIATIDKLKIDVESETKPVEEKAALILTNNGWIHNQLFKK